MVSGGTAIAPGWHVRSSIARAYEPPDEFPTIEVPADPNGLAYDCHDDTLYIADGGGAVLVLEQGRLRRLATIDAAGCLVNQLGGVAVSRDGAVYVARLGHGRAGAIFEISPCGAVRPLPGVSTDAWHLGVVYDATAHALYTTRYHKVAKQPCDGAIERIDLTTGEVDVVLEGLGKPVGVARLGSSLLISDARRAAVLRVDLVAGRAVRCIELATGIDRPDSIAACDIDAVVVTTFCPDSGVGSVRKLWLDGTIATIASGHWEPRGIASDGERAFVSIRHGSRVLVIPS